MAGAPSGLMKNKLEAYKCCSNDVIHFKLVRSKKDVENEDIAFRPDMTHQLFGDHESIFGYRDLHLDLFYTAGALITYLKIKYLDKVTPEKFDGISADDVEKPIAEMMPPGYLTNIDDFVSSLEKEHLFRPPGEKVNSYQIHKDNCERTFEVFKASVLSPGFKNYHERLQTFLLFFIDAASYIDIDDDRWTFYLLFEKYQQNGCVCYAVVGYMTVYNYYAYLEKIRPRISQVLILPPFQKLGHGAKLLQTFYNDTYERPEVLDITVEDPSENFQRLRDFVDVRNCMKLSSYKRENLSSGFCEKMSTEARTKLKLSKRQARRCYEILRLKSVNIHDEDEFRAYRLDVKKRLNLPFHKNGRDFKKLETILQPDELSATMPNLNAEQKYALLDKQFNETVQIYRHVIDRLECLAEP
ncbi:histone acetyltransferase type B catalytic subunit-like [Octopus vulgaris]|uniref:Histone acetyltransferase type B catalytic subunit-like n=2 Tax=Octopus TaxID=6643 RepID=A0AA36F211_OCTVU|nr:histone acetyltransferase type B catalytic subunit isoform X2 [Octopus sinensis]CAI9719858.1 histone acetyltransferase type B catalytic subunit-like [Octopus vulgaris]